MKQLPERYAKIWQYMTDSNMPINNNRIAGLLQELFVSRLGSTKELLKNNIKTMKIRDKFDLRGDGWMQSILAHWEHTALPELMQEVIAIKQTPDIKDRAPKMRAFLQGANASTSPMNVLSVMEEEYRHDKESLHDPVVEDIPEEYLGDDDSPGFLRRAGGLAGRGAKGALGAVGSVAAMGAGAVGMSLMQHTKVLGGIVKGGMMAAGVAKVAYGGFKRAAASSSGSRLGSSIKGLFGVGRSPVRPRPQHDFTPREEELEGGGVKDVLQRIEANTAALLEKFSVKGQGSSGGLGGLSGLLSGLGGGLLNFIKGPAMLAAIATLGTAMALAFGKKAVEILCEKFPALCPTNSNLIDSLATTLDPVSQGAQKFAGAANDMTGKSQTIERQRAINRAGQMPLAEREAQVHDALSNVRLNGKAYSPEQIAGIMGSMKGENSTFDPTAVNPTSGAFGLMQLVGGRKQLYLDWVRNKEGDKDPNSIQNQIMFQEYEYSVGKNVKPTGYTGVGHFNEKSHYDVLLKNKTVEGAALAYGDEIMRFKVGDPNMTPEKIKKHDAMRVKYAEEFYPEVLARQETGKVKLKPKGEFEVGFSEPNQSFYNKSVSMEATLKNLENKIRAEKDPVKRRQLEDAYANIANNPNYSTVAPKATAPKAPSLTAPSSPTSSGEGKGNTTVINNVPQQQGGGSKTRPSHRSPDVSIDKQLMEDKRHSSTR